MKSPQQPPMDDDDVRRYLLAEFTDEQEAAFETALLADEQPPDEMVSKLEVVEDELVDDYVFGRLSKAQTAVLKERSATSERLRNKLQTARLLDGYAGGRKASSGLLQQLTALLRQVKPVAYMYVAAMASLVLVASLQFFQNLQLRESLEIADTQRRQATEDRNSVETRMQREVASLSDRLDAMTRQTADAREMASRTTANSMSIASVLLAPGLVRSSSQTARLVVKDETAVEFRLDVGLVEFPSYNVSVLDADGRKVIELFQLRARARDGGADVVVSLLAKQVAPGDYLFVLHGVNRDGTTERLDGYNVRVSRQQAHGRFPAASELAARQNRVSPNDLR